MIDAKIIKDMAATMARSGTSPYESDAEVVRVDDNIAWVHFPGGVPETPVDIAINAKKGDKVRVRVADGVAYITGNLSAPPTDDTVANEANKKANEAIEQAKTAVKSAEEMEELASVKHEKLTTANGYDEYWKHPDGRLICAKYISTSISCSSSWGSMYYSEQVQLGDWPVEFVDKPCITVTPGRSDVFQMALKEASKTSAGNIGYARPVQSSNTPIYIYLIAIGQWK